MIRKKITLPTGEIVKRRTAAQIVQVAGRYQSRIMIEHENKVVNAKSMLGLLSLVNTNGVLTLTADGVDEQAAVDHLLVLLGEIHKTL
ncbi:MAG: HPr family phosphocarrier protein [Clostridiales bacterium]|nr:HPr family phosphocarrier protein [Clostridiales bacterium]